MSDTYKCLQRIPKPGLNASTQERKDYKQVLRLCITGELAKAARIQQWDQNNKLGGLPSWINEKEIELVKKYPPPTLVVYEPDPKPMNQLEELKALSDSGMVFDESGVLAYSPNVNYGKDELLKFQKKHIQDIISGEGGNIVGDRVDFTSDISDESKEQAAKTIGLLKEEVDRLAIGKLAERTAELTEQGMSGEEALKTADLQLRGELKDEAAINVLENINKEIKDNALDFKDAKETALLKKTGVKSKDQIIEDESIFLDGVEMIAFDDRKRQGRLPDLSTAEQLSAAADVAADAGEYETAAQYRAAASATQTVSDLTLIDQTFEGNSTWSEDMQEVEAADALLDFVLTNERKKTRQDRKEKEFALNKLGMNSSLASDDDIAGAAQMKLHRRRMVNDPEYAKKWNNEIASEKAELDEQGKAERRAAARRRRAQQKAKKAREKAEKNAADRKEALTSDPAALRSGLEVLDSQVQAIAEDDSLSDSERIAALNQLQKNRKKNIEILDRQIAGSNISDKQVATL
ncbi:hypothetical protein OAT10_05095, partial [Luminiphilus sp.]|nr:hypothetical protein [Luminiphilus sp.]